jgi:cell division protein FtsZ
VQEEQAPAPIIAPPAPEPVAEEAERFIEETITPAPAIAIEPAPEPEPVVEVAAAAPEPAAVYADDSVLELEAPMAAPAAEPAAEELVLDAGSMMHEPPAADPAPAAEDAPERRRWLVSETSEPETPAPRVAAAGGTLFERMSNLARGAAKADEPETGSADPLDIPRFLNRQNNQ